MAVIEITKRGKKFQAQFRTDDGRIDKIAGSWATQQEAKRDLLNWKQQVNRARKLTNRMMRISTLKVTVTKLLMTTKRKRKRKRKKKMMVTACILLAS